MGCVLHTAHHRIHDKPVLSTYDPSADVTWTGADPTTNIEAGRK
jgi:hypothetical protein